jgi:UDP-N-acetylmuramate dehydrogenase
MIIFQENVPLFQFTTFQIGGRARYYIEPSNSQDIIDSINTALDTRLPVLIMGKGSNLLISDNGWPGIVINLSKHYVRCTWDDECRVTCCSGALLDRVVREAVLNGCAGIEELSGIPGTIGGGVIMNAGAFQTCIADTFEQLTSFDWVHNAKRTIMADEMKFGYRTSFLKNTPCVILSARFRFQKKESPEKLQCVRREILHRRKQKQPLNVPNCGSVFKRPEGNYAGALIEQCDLKGLRSGAVEVSLKHANFIINKGEGTANDVRRVMRIVQQRVYEHCGILLEPEVISVGTFDEPLFGCNEFPNKNVITDK